MARKYSKDSAVSFETWQTELAFDRLNGKPRETKARNSSDARYWYDNYVEAWNNAANVEVQHALDQQHGFFGGELYDEPEPTVAPPSEPTVAPPPPEVVDPVIEPTPEDISPEPDDDSTNDGADNTPEDNEIIDDELDDLDDPETPEDESAPSQDPQENNEDDTVLTVRDLTPDDSVVDPKTGKRYASPEDARKAGITDWVWAKDYEG